MNSYKNKVTKAFNNFNGKNDSSLDSFYDEDVEFTDPVKKIKGLKNLKAYYAHAYKNVISIEFDFKETLQEDKKFGASWVMTLAARGLNGGKPFPVHGFSHFHFNDESLVVYHRDYLDLGEMVYEKIPLQGLLISGIKKMLS